MRSDFACINYFHFSVSYQKKSNPQFWLHLILFILPNKLLYQIYLSGRLVRHYHYKMSYKWLGKIRKECPKDKLKCKHLSQLKGVHKIYRCYNFPIEFIHNTKALDALYLVSFCANCHVPSISYYTVLKLIGALMWNSKCIWSVLDRRYKNLLKFCQNWKYLLFFRSYVDLVICFCILELSGCGWVV